MKAANAKAAVLVVLGGVLLVHCAFLGSAQELNPNSTFYLNAPAPAPGSCPNGNRTATLNPEVTQGPYYLDEQLFRSNITERESGLPFQARITVLDTSCNPVVGALIDVWHCNATGTYSGYTESGPLGMPGTSAGGGARMLMQMSEQQTDNTTFLRGTVQTDVNGVAAVDTIVPGWYSGRATHVHIMIHIPTTESSDEEVEYNSSHVSHTGQFYFSDELLDSVYELAPYSQHTGNRTALSNDMVYQSGGNDATQIFTINYPSDPSAGLVGSVTAIIDPSADHTEGFSTGGMRDSAPNPAYPAAATSSPPPPHSPPPPVPSFEPPVAQSSMDIRPVLPALGPRMATPLTRSADGLGAAQGPRGGLPTLPATTGRKLAL